MDLKHRFWQIVALSLSILALERRWVVAGFVVLSLGWLGGMLYMMLG
ncbi:MAG: hypothetical protein M3220_02825 [Chloroflexota bacterium]|nr:hypothetical protein [Chloroflexota bacterium]